MTGMIFSRQETASTEEMYLEQLLAQYLKSMQNGSLTVIKQDGHVIQLNISEKYCLRGDRIFPGISGAEGKQLNTGGAWL